MWYLCVISLSVASICIPSIMHFSLSWMVSVYPARLCLGIPSFTLHCYPLRLLLLCGFFFPAFALVIIYVLLVWLWKLHAAANGYFLEWLPLVLVVFLPLNVYILILIRGYVVNFFGIAIYFYLL